MRLLMVGLAHQTAPVEVRERLAFSSSAALAQALLSLKETLGPAGECVVLSTCNRTELYVSAPEDISAPECISRLTEVAHGLPADDLEDYFEERRGHRAVEHLFRVTAGLESMILGEPDIVRQVKTAYAQASDGGTTGPTLNPLFHRALSVAKRARTETQLGRGAFSVGHAAAEMAESIFGSLAGRSILILGAGDMSEATARHLAASGANSVLVANRTFDRAARLAESLNGRAISYDAFPEHLAQADIVIASTAAPHTIVSKPMVADAVRLRRRRPLFLIDIAVPRDIDADVADLDGVYLYNIDDLRAVVDADSAERRQEAERASAIVHSEAVAFSAWLRTQRAAAPLVSGVRAKMDTIKQEELQRLRQRLAYLSLEEWQMIEAAFTSTVNKIAHAPTLKIKDYAADGSEAAENKLDTVREVFGLGAAEERAP